MSAATAAVQATETQTVLLDNNTSLQLDKLEVSSEYDKNETGVCFPRF